MQIFMNVLFYGILACCAVTVLAWCVCEWMNKWQAGVLVGAASALGVVALLAQTVMLFFFKGEGYTTAGLSSLAAFALALSVCYMHFSLMGTGVAPLGAILVFVLEGASMFTTSLGVFMPLENDMNAPWMQKACVLGAIGVGLALAYGILFVLSIIRQSRLTETSGELYKLVTAKMPKMASHFGWWSLLALSFAVGAYMIWCQNIYGVLWIWQPLFVLFAAAWLLVFLGKDVLKLR